MANRKKCLVDTSVLIALFRKNEEAKMALDNLAANDAYICDVTFLEILAGCFTVEKREYAINFLDAYGLVKNNEQVSDKSIQLMKRYCVQRIGLNTHPNPHPSQSPTHSLPAFQKNYLFVMIRQMIQYRQRTIKLFRKNQAD